MSINNRKRSITEGNRALELFTNREGLVRIFATYINDDPSPEKILFFHLVEIANALSDTSWGAIGKAVLGLFSKHFSIHCNHA
ncbi:hypothetical protein [Scytonema sp. PRP1]|uniref:hypothetical protein n=1 Tax=Scytonema sp. PRP1 TaxID=3120513 RepID=UPI002FD63527